MNLSPSQQLPDQIYLDSDILVINKPPQLLSIPDGYDPTLPHLKSILSPQYDKLWIVHRLDRDTSGLMILARSAEAHRHLNQAFRERKVRKIYHGLVTPTPDWQEKIIDSPLRVDVDRSHRTRVDQGGKPAWTRCKVIKRFSDAALLEIEIQTGITHQIRAHLRALNTALLGDTLYQVGLPSPAVAAPRVMLHAREITFPHPTTGEKLVFTSQYPDDFREAYTKLRFTTVQDGWL